MEKDDGSIADIISHVVHNAVVIAVVPVSTVKAPVDQGDICTGCDIAVGTAVGRPDHCLFIPGNGIQQIVDPGDLLLDLVCVQICQIIMVEGMISDLASQGICPLNLRKPGIADFLANVKIRTVHSVLFHHVQNPLGRTGGVSAHRPVIEGKGHQLFRRIDPADIGVVNPWIRRLRGDHSSGKQSRQQGKHTQDAQ